MSDDGCKACGPSPEESPAPGGRRRLPLRKFIDGKSPTNWKLLGISLLGAVLLSSAILWLVSGSATAKLEKQGYFDAEVTIAPGKEFGYIIIVGPLGSAYGFEVTPFNGPAMMACGRVDDGDSEKFNSSDLERVGDGAVEVAPGKTKSLSGLMQRGRYLWVVSNPSNKPLRVKIRFG